MPGPVLSDDGISLTVHIPLTFTRHGGRKLIVSPQGQDTWTTPSQKINHTMIKALARAHRWKAMLESGAYATAEDLASSEKINSSYLARVLRLTLLSPTIVEAILDGRQPIALQLHELLRPFPLEWKEQILLFEI